MRRRLPAAADVRTAIADARRALAATPAPAPVVTWEPAGTGTCSFCGEDGPLRKPTGGTLALCERTIAELASTPAIPRGPRAEEVLATVERWMAAKPGEPVGGGWDAAPGQCAVCRRDAAMLPQLVGSAESAICSDCIAQAASTLGEAALAPFLASEIDAALHEMKDFERLADGVDRRNLRSNPTLALSLVRLLATPDESLRVQEKLAALVRALDT